MTLADVKRERDAALAEVEKYKMAIKYGHWAAQDLLACDNGDKDDCDIKFVGAEIAMDAIEAYLKK